MTRVVKECGVRSPVASPAAAPSPVATAQVSAAANPPQAKARRVRRAMKRTAFRVPEPMPAPVRALWKAASPAERERAHQTAVTVLKSWLGKSSREEAAAELGLTPLRFWQLSQQAVAGLVAGCLTQPRFRGRVVLGAGEEPRAALLRRILVLEREVEASRRLIGLLRELPGHQVTGAGAAAEARHEKARGPRKPAKPQATTGGGPDARGPVSA